VAPVAEPGAFLEGFDEGERAILGSLSFAVCVGRFYEDLAADQRGQRPLAPGRLVGQHSERGFQAMGEIADMGAGALDDLAVGVDQRVGLACKRRDFLRKLSGQSLGSAGADGCETVGDAL